jgi:hypothetical protein
MNRLISVTVIAVVLSALLFPPFKSNAETAGTAVLNEARVREIVTDYLLQKTKDLGVDLQLKKLV